MENMISVIIPVYNGEFKISKSLNSLVKQNYKNFEVVIVNDGSTDNTLMKIKKYALKLNIKVVSKENEGVAIARNTGIQMAQGSYVCFLDADDEFNDGFLDKMLDKAKLEKSDVVYCGYCEISNSISKQVSCSFKTKNVLNNYIKGKTSIHTNGWLIKKKYIEDNQIYFRENTSWGEDFEFFCKVLFNTKKITFVRDYLTNYYVDHSPNQLSTFNLNKIDADYESIMYLISTELGENKDIRNALLNYRLQALIVYRLNTSIQRNEKQSQILFYYEKYSDYFKKKSLFTNGLRSIKLAYHKRKLNNEIRKIQLIVKKKEGGDESGI
ncbi:glycosyltransferase family 2 protein [Exiguobacterium sp. SH4S7]|uniref:glycosyltransferase family 2 protein n=1 Tax=Exiguobacterium sp. SH4S7 TaxID=2510958 RepID=UPI001375CFAC|nr:glycosyltransferase [Exiguobacterium sp. SH4S7]